MTICVCDYEAPAFYSVHIHKARKPHRCWECNGVIAAGEPYEYSRGQWDGDFQIFKTCERCLDLRMWVKNSVPCFCWGHGNMIDDAREAIVSAWERAPSETVGLRFGLLRRIAMLNRFNRERRAA